MKRMKRPWTVFGEILTEGTGHPPSPGDARELEEETEFHSLSPFFSEGSERSMKYRRIQKSSSKKNANDSSCARRSLADRAKLVHSPRRPSTPIKQRHRLPLLQIHKQPYSPRVLRNRQGSTKNANTVGSSKSPRLSPLPSSEKVDEKSLTSVPLQLNRQLHSPKSVITRDKKEKIEVIDLEPPGDSDPRILFDGTLRTSALPQQISENSKVTIKRQKIFKTTNFDVTEFLRRSQNPFDYFLNKNRKCVFNESCLTFLENYFTNINRSSIVRRYKEAHYNLSLAAARLNEMRTTEAEPRSFKKCTVEDVYLLQEWAFVFRMKKLENKCSKQEECVTIEE